MYQDKPSLDELYSQALINDINKLTHYGMPRRSGRYPWGSGEDPYQHEDWGKFTVRLNKLKSNGWTETPENIKKEFHMSTTEFRREKKYADYEDRLYRIKTAQRLKEKGTEENGWKPMNNTEIGKVMGINESSVRSLLNEDRTARLSRVQKTADSLQKIVDEKGMVDVGSGVEQQLGITRDRLDLALYILEKKGYHLYKGGIPQVTNKGQQSTQTVLCAPDKQHKDIYEYDKVSQLIDYSVNDDGETIGEKKKINYPVSLDSKRLQINYREDGGSDKDGLIEIRPGVKDLRPDANTYAQVRIMVDGTHYLKGMLGYSNDLPEGIDVRFNTNKPKGTPMKDVLKPIKSDPDNPFGSLIKKQNYYIGDDGKEHQGVINYRANEGDWDEWKNSLPSQFLSKQSITLAQKQLNLAKIDKVDEYNDILKINNPTIRKHYLLKLAEQCDKAAEDLQAAALPGQRYQVIMPVPSMKDTEVYAPNYKHGSYIALVRFPHGGPFETPILRVNNHQKDAEKLIGSNPVDAICINAKVAERLSGADFDGDTVMCIPTHDSRGLVKITSKPALKGLEGFDPKLEYGGTEFKDKDGISHWKDDNGNEYPIISAKNKQKQMGVVSNLITDMTLGGASSDEIARAVRHSMVVIDAEKHHLNWKKSEVDNNIEALKREYQNGGGASTIISRAKSEYSEPRTQGSPKINIKGKSWYDPSKPEGALIYKTAEDLYYPKYRKNKNTGLIDIWTTDGKKISYNPKDPKDISKYAPVRTKKTRSGKDIYSRDITNKDGTIHYITEERRTKTTKMGHTDDAYTLVSDNKNPMELIYADYANSMKSLANQARKEYATTKGTGYNRTAAKTYSKEVASLDAKLNEALKNAPIERHAERMANIEVSNKREEAEKNGETLSNEDIRKASQKAITKYRQDLGSIKRSDRNIPITDREWEAIQSGAISENKLQKIINNTDIDELRARATPKQSNTLSDFKVARIKAMANSNYTNSQIAEALGISTSTVAKYLKGSD